MSDKQVWLCVILWYLLIIFAMVWSIVKSYRLYSKSYTRYSKFDNLKLALKDFLNGPAYKAYASVLFIIFVIPFLFIGTFFGVVLPLIILKIFCILSGIIFMYYFLQSIFDTAKSIKKEKFRTTIKAKWQGVLSFFVFALFIYAYVNQLNH